MAVVQEHLASLDGVVVLSAEGGKIVVVIEGESTGALGASLSEMSLLEGVVAANMVFEHVEFEEITGDEKRTDAA
jgi:nitrate reductase NapD